MSFLTNPFFSSWITDSGLSTSPGYCGKIEECLRESYIDQKVDVHSKREMPKNTMVLEFEFTSSIQSELASVLMINSKTLFTPKLWILLTQCGLSTEKLYQIAKLSGAVHRAEHILAERRRSINNGSVGDKNGSTFETGMTYSFSCVGHEEAVMKEFETLIKMLLDHICPGKVDMENVKQAMKMVCNENQLKKNFFFLVEPMMRNALFEMGQTDTFGHDDGYVTDEILKSQIILTNAFISFFKANFGVTIKHSMDIKTNFENEIEIIITRCLETHLKNCSICHELRSPNALAHFKNGLEKTNFNDYIKVKDGCTSVPIPSLTVDGVPMIMIAVEHGKGSSAHLPCMTFNLESFDHTFKFIPSSFPLRDFVNKTIDVFNVSLSLPGGQDCSFPIYSNADIISGSKKSNVDQLYDLIREHVKQQYGNIKSFGFVYRTSPYRNLGNYLKGRGFPKEATKVIREFCEKKQLSRAKDCELERALINAIFGKKALEDEMFTHGIKVLARFLDFNESCPSLFDLSLGQRGRTYDAIDIAKLVQDDISEREFYMKFFKCVWEDKNTNLEDPKLLDQPWLQCYIREHNLENKDVVVYPIPACVTVILIKVKHAYLSTNALVLLSKFIFYTGRDIYRSELAIGYNAALNNVGDDGLHILFTCPSSHLEAAFKGIEEFQNQLSDQRNYEEIKNYMLLVNIEGPRFSDEEFQSLVREVKQSGIHAQGWEIRINICYGALAPVGKPSPTDLSKTNQASGIISNASGSDI